MARAQSTDFLQIMRFNADVVGVGGVARLQRPGVSGLPQSGFNSISLPEVTVEAAEYKEGTDIYTKKQPGNPTMNELTFSRGVTRLDSSFYEWVRVVMEGSGEYRADVDIKHFHRDTSLTRPFPVQQQQAPNTAINTDSPAVIYHVREAYPGRVKPSADLDATSSEIALAEVDVVFENFEVEYFPAP